jgi:integrase
MPKLRITKTNIDKHMPLTEKGTVDYWDTGDGSVKGFGVRVGTESKTFFVQVDVPARKEHGKQYKTVKSIIGKYGLFTAELAQKEAKERIRRMKQGAEATPKDAISLRDMLNKHLELKDFAKGTEKAYKSQIPEKFKTWMDMPISEVAALEPEIIVERFKQIEKDSGKMAAKNVFGKLQSILNHSKILYPKHVSRNPCEVLSAGKFWPKTNARKDCLRGNDFKQFYEGIQLFNEITRDAFLFCLYQGLRNMEAASLKWEYVDIENAVLLIPDTKNDAPLNVPLSAQSVAILKHRKANNPEGSPYVFPTQKAHLNKTGHIVLKSDVLKLNTGLDLSVHGLRRSFIDIADNKVKLRRQDVDRLTNHIDGTVTGKHYSHKDIEDLRGDLKKVCNEIERLMLEGVGAKVIHLGNAQAMGG